MAVLTRSAKAGGGAAVVGFWALAFAVEPSIISLLLFVSSFAFSSWLSHRSVKLSMVSSPVGTSSAGADGILWAQAEPAPRVTARARLRQTRIRVFTLIMYPLRRGRRSSRRRSDLRRLGCRFPPHRWSEP